MKIFLSCSLFFLAWGVLLCPLQAAAESDSSVADEFGAAEVSSTDASQKAVASAPSKQPPVFRASLPSALALDLGASAPCSQALPLSWKNKASVSLSPLDASLRALDRSRQASARAPVSSPCKAIDAKISQTPASNASPTSKPVLPKISRQRYLWGGILGSLLGFGIGHAIVGEYKTFGWVFTTAEILSLGGFPLISAFVIAAIAWDGKIAMTGDRLISIWSGFFYTGLFLFLAFRIWQIIDIWLRPFSRIEDAASGSSTKPASSPRPSSPKVFLLPFVPEHGGIGLSLLGRF